MGSSASRENQGERNILMYIQMLKFIFSSRQRKNAAKQLKVKVIG